MPVTEYLIRNAELYPDEVALVELNPDEKDTRRTTWKEFDLIQRYANITGEIIGVYLMRKAKRSKQYAYKPWS